MILEHTITELRDYYQQQPIWCTITLIVVVINLATNCHTFVKEMYPNAIQIADCFHVNCFVIDAL